MSDFFTDYSAQIKAREKEIEELKKQAQDLERKQQAVAEYNEAVKAIAKKHNVEEWELVLSHGDRLAGYLKRLVKLDEPPKFFDQISGLFSGDSKESKGKPGRKPGRKPAKKKVAKKAGAAKVAPKKATRAKGRKEPKLETGTYVNPKSGETVAKIKRAPRALLDWVNEHGVAEVRKWRQG